MFYILLFISVLIFGIIWTIITNKYLPSETLDTKILIELVTMRDNAQCF